MDKVVRYEQIELKLNHLYEGKIDGIAGPKTKLARSRAEKLDSNEYFRTRPMGKLITNRTERFGKPWNYEGLLVRIKIPWMKDVSGYNEKGFLVHKTIAENVENAFENIKMASFDGDIKSFDGSYVFRSVRGSTSISSHSYGIAIDLNCSDNWMGDFPALLGDDGSLVRIVQIMQCHGFYWGGNFTKYDGMHFEYCG